MNDSKKCPKCQSQMQEGFIPDRTYGGVLVSKWYAGPPQQATFLGMKSPSIKADYNDGLPITAWRCPKCALIEYYAPDKAGH